MDSIRQACSHVVLKRAATDTSGMEEEIQLAARWLLYNAENDPGLLAYLKAGPARDTGFAFDTSVCASKVRKLLDPFGFSGYGDAGACRYAQREIV